MRRIRIRWMKRAGADIAIEPLQFVAPRQRPRAGDFQGKVDDAQRAVHRMLFGGEEFSGPLIAMIDAVPPIVGDAFDQRLNAVEFDRSLGGALLHERAVSGGFAAKSQRPAVLGLFHGEIERPPSDAVVDRRETRYDRAEDAVDEGIDRRSAGRIV